MSDMPENQEKPELEYITPQGDPGGFIDPDIAQDPDDLFQQELPQVPKEQESEPFIRVLWRAVGRPRRQTIGQVQKGDRTLNAQDPFRTDITVYENYGAGQKELDTTTNALGDFEQTGVLETDFPERPSQEAERMDYSDIFRKQFSGVKKRRGGASRKHTPVGNPGSRIISSKTRS